METILAITVSLGDHGRKKVSVLPPIRITIPVLSPDCLVSQDDLRDHLINAMLSFSPRNLELLLLKQETETPNLQI